MTEEGLQSITRFKDVWMIYKLKHDAISPTENCIIPTKR